MKKIVSILLVLILALNIFGFGVLRVRASAVAPAVIALLDLAKYVAIGFLGGEAAGAIVQGAGIGSEFNAQYFADQVTSAITEDNFIEAELDEHSETVFSVSSNCPSECVEFAGILVTELNSLPGTVRWVDPYGGGLSDHFVASQYEAVKTKVVNSYTAYLEKKRLGDAFSLMEFEPTYGFSFTGPLTPVQFQSTNTFVSNQFDGWTFTAPVIYPWEKGTVRADTEAEARSSGGNYIESNSGKFVPYFTVDYPNYVNCYTGIIYNNQLFVRSPIWQNKCEAFIVAPGWYYNSDGQNLDGAGCTSLKGLPFFFFYNPDINATFSISNYDDVSGSDFTETIPGATLDSSYTPEEAAIAAGVAAGILPANSNNITLGIDSSGNIVEANGITIEQLQALADQLAEGQIKFEDFEEYLSYITALLMQANVNTGTINDVLNGLRAYEQQQADALDQINEKMDSITEIISSTSEITVPTDFDIETPDIITDKFPFSLPFDVYHVFNLFSAEPVAPQFTIPLQMEGVFDLSFDVDLSEYEWIANIVRWLLYAVFIVGLIIATNKLIGRG